MHLFTTTDLDLTPDKCQRISGFHVSAGGTAAAVALRNGGASGPVFIEIKVPANGSVHFSASTRILFPKGLYVDTDANVSRGGIQEG